MCWQDQNQDMCYVPAHILFPNDLAVRLCLFAVCTIKTVMIVLNIQVVSYFQTWILLVIVNAFDEGNIVVDNTQCIMTMID